MLCCWRPQKLPRETVVAELAALGVSSSVADGVLAAMATRSVDDLAALLGEGHEAVGDMRALWRLAAAYGADKWLVFDASVVRGLAYYTGIVFEASDRAGALRCATHPYRTCCFVFFFNFLCLTRFFVLIRSAICGGGRYDKLLSAYGGADAPCAGFGFGDAVIIELLADKGLLPTNLGQGSVHDVVAPADEAARGGAAAVAAALRSRGRRVDLCIDTPPKKAKTVAKRAAGCGAERLLMVSGDGGVRVKTLATFDEADSTVESIVAGG